jgi:LacI family transcriptional regulator
MFQKNDSSRTSNHDSLMSAASLNEVMKRAGVSASTVSRVLRNQPGISEKTRERVKKAVSETGYQPNARLQKLFTRVHSKRWSLLFLVPARYTSGGSEERSFFERMIWPLEREIATRKCALMVSSWESGLLEDGIPYAVTEGLADGIIAMGGSPPLIRSLASRVPLVLFNSEDRLANADIVTPDVDRSAFLQLEHLRGLGHERIACFRPRGPNLPGIPSRQDKRFWLAYEDFFTTSGLDLPDSYLDPIAVSPETNTSAVEAFLDRLFRGADRPTAIVTTDVYASFLIPALQSRGLRVPDDVSVFGYDDDSHGFPVSIPLSTFRQDFDAMAAVAVDRLLGRLDGEAKPIQVIEVNGSLIHRNSVARAVA